MLSPRQTTRLVAARTPGHADDLRDPARLGLHLVGDVEVEEQAVAVAVTDPAVAEQVDELPRVGLPGHHQHLPDPESLQQLERVVDHRPPPTGSRCLLVTRVSSWSRVASPPAQMSPLAIGRRRESNSPVRFRNASRHPRRRPRRRHARARGLVRAHRGDHERAHSPSGKPPTPVPKAGSASERAPSSSATSRSGASSARRGRRSCAGPAP